MKQSRFSIYQVDIKYIRDLSKVDENVRSVSPQINKQNRPFIGIVIINGCKQYCIPFSSPKPKHSQMKNDVDFTKILDNNNKIIGVLNFNSMIPVNESVLIPLNLEQNKNEAPEVIHYKKMVKKQLNWCQKNQDSIVTKANKLYKMITETPEKSRNLTRRCCDFKKLEQVLEKWLARSQTNNFFHGLGDLQERVRKINEARKNGTDQTQNHKPNKPKH